MYHFLFLLISTLIASAQLPQGLGDLNLLSGSANPALALIGYEAKVIMYPTDPTDITFCVVQLADSISKGPGTFSLEVAPYWFLPASDDLSYSEFARGGGPGIAVPQTLTFSLAISNEMETPVGGTGIALGAQASLIRPPVTGVAGRLDTLQNLHASLSENFALMIDSLRDEDPQYRRLESRLYSEGLSEEEINILESLLVQQDSIIKQRALDNLDSAIRAAREYAENFGLTRSGNYLDLACGIVEVFEEDDFEANRVYRYGCWLTGGVLEPPFTFSAIGRYQGYHYGETEQDIDIGLAASMNLSTELEFSAEYLHRQSKLTNGETEATYRMDVALTIPIFRHASVSVTLGRDFDEDGEGSLMTLVNLVTGLGSIRPLPF